MGLCRWVPTVGLQLGPQTFICCGPKSFQSIWTGTKMFAVYMDQNRLTFAVPFGNPYISSGPIMGIMAYNEFVIHKL